MKTWLDKQHLKVMVVAAAAAAACVA